MDGLSTHIAATLRLALAAAFFSSAVSSHAVCAQGADRAKLLADAREAAKGGDAAKCRELCNQALNDAPDSLSLRFELAQFAEQRKEPYLAREHYAEIVNYADRAARLKEKPAEEDVKIGKEAAAKMKSMPDVYAQNLSKSIKVYADAALKVARLAKAQKNWKFTADVMRSVKDLFDNSPGVLDPKDGREVEAAKLMNEAITKKGEDKQETDKMRGEISDAVAGLARDLNKVSEQAVAIYDEVRGPHTRRRAILPLGILVSLKNDPDGQSKRAEEIWKRAAEIEPSAPLKLRFANDAIRYTLVVNGIKAAESRSKTDVEANSAQRELDVRLFRETNLIGFYGHEIADNGRKGGKAEYRSRVWFLVDVPLNEKDHFTTDNNWVSLTKPPSGWDICPFGCFDTFPVPVIGSTDMWDYEKTKNWKGSTLAGDPTDCWLRRVFDLPVAVADMKPAGKTDAGATTK